EGPGRPILYGTTAEFLQHFGLNSLSELPPFDQVEEADPQLGENILKD
ncbi:MAG: SMC-Scp complex subunit ScpB, partial [Anaerolineaceae bacterium]|nr:SMC-Scp complex subunit ScpB [Anaerolineaceae bacterium]